MRNASLIASITTGLLLTACAHDHAHTSASGEPCNDATCTAPKPGTITSVNSRCVIMPEDMVDPALTTEWNGQKVGFCCKGCIPKWNRMTDAQKTAALAKVTGK